MPTMAQAGVYSAVNHYLKAVDAARTTDAEVVAQKIRDMPVEDFFAEHGAVRADGRMVHDMYLAQVKTPQESPRGPWDYYNILRTIPAASWCALSRRAIARWSANQHRRGDAVSRKVADFSDTHHATNK